MACKEAHEIAALFSAEEGWHVVIEHPQAGFEIVGRVGTNIVHAARLRQGLLHTEGGANGSGRRLPVQGVLARYDPAMAQVAGAGQGGRLRLKRENCNGCAGDGGTRQQ